MPLPTLPAPDSSASSTPVAPLRRKIAAILAADVAGYSRLIANDEEGTLHALADARSVFDGRVARAGGRIFNTAGDSVMCEFDSAVEAVRAAIDVQAELEARSAALAAGRRLRFRIGITIGDVVERDGDLLGDGVNIAARLEALAPPGGICVSRSVHESVANKVAATFRELGARKVKNIPQPIHAYVIAPPEPPPTELDAMVPTRLTLRNEPAARTRAAGRRPLWPRLAATAALGVAAISLVALFAADRLGAPAPPPEAPPVAGNETAGAGRQGSPPTRADAASVVAPKTEASKPDAPKPPALRRMPPAEAAAVFADRAADGLIADPRSVPEWYHNARHLEARGDRAGARQAYAAAAPAAGDAVDFHVRYGALLRGLSGPGAPRQVYAELARLAPSRAVALVGALSADGNERRSRMDALAGEGDDVAALFVWGETLLDPRGGGPTLTDRRLAFAALDRFLEGAAADALADRFIDRAFLDGWLDTARRRRGEIETFFAGTATRPIASFLRAGSGWTARLTLPEPASAVTVRVGDSGTFAPARTTGGATASAAEFDLPASLGRTVLYVAYRDRVGRDAGPFPLGFDPVAATAESGRDALERFPDSWVAFRPDLPELLSYAGLVSNRCAIRKAVIGYGDAPPRDTLPLPACDASGPSTMPSGASGLLTLPDGVDTVQLQLTYADGSESQVRTFRRP